MADLPDPAFKLLPAGAKVKVGLHTLAEVLSKLSDQEARLEERDGALFFVVDTCPECWERTSDDAICHGTTGILLEALHWLTDGKKYTVTETGCVARGEPACSFEIGAGQEEAAIEESEGTASDTVGA